MLRHNLQPPVDALQVYSRFKVTLWLDSLLILLNVYIPTVVAMLLMIYQLVTDQTACLLPRIGTPQQEHYINKLCSLQVSNNLLQRLVVNHMEEVTHGSLQHVFLPPILLLLALLHYLPHLWWKKTAGESARRQLTMVKNELQCFREQTMRELNRRGIDSEMNIVDFSASVSELPLLHTTRMDWTLNAYLSSWQESNYFFRCYIKKHGVLLALEAIICLITFIVLCAYSGAPFATHFQCVLPLEMNFGYTTRCVLNSAVILNISIIFLYLLNVAAMGAQAVTYYRNFAHSRITFKENEFMQTAFFTSYMKLLAYSLFKNDIHRVKAIHFNTLPGFLRSDLHFMSLLCEENQPLLTDSLYVHFWMDRFTRQMQQRDYVCSSNNRLPSTAACKARTYGLMKAEDVSFRLNFTKVKIKVELNDLFL